MLYTGNEHGHVNKATASWRCAGRIIKRLGVKLALCLSPAVALAGMLLIASHPTARWVAGE